MPSTAINPNLQVAGSNGFVLLAYPGRFTLTLSLDAAERLGDELLLAAKGERMKLAHPAGKQQIDGATP